MGLLGTWTELHWTMKIVTAVAGVVTPVAGAVVAVPPAWTALDFPVPASRGFVVAHVDRLKMAADTTRDSIRDVQVDILESRRNATDLDIFDQKIKQKATPGDRDLEWRIHQQENELKALNRRIEELKRR